MPAGQRLEQGRRCIDFPDRRRVHQDSAGPRWGRAESESLAPASQVGTVPQTPHREVNQYQWQTKIHGERVEFTHSGNPGGSGEAGPADYITVTNASGLAKIVSGRRMEPW